MQNKITGIVKEYDGFTGIINYKDIEFLFTTKDLKEKILVDDIVNFIPEVMSVNNCNRYLARFIEKN